jgi:hypothetical protein
MLFISMVSSYSTKPTCSSAVTTLAAMGMIISDNRITSAALKEMPKLTETNFTMNNHILTCLSMFLTVDRIDRFVTFHIDLSFDLE